MTITPERTRLSADEANSRFVAGQQPAYALEPRLARQYEASLLATGRRCVAAYRARTQVLTAGTWNEAQHPRDPGGEGGGEFVSKQSGDLLKKGGTYSETYKGVALKVREGKGRDYGYSEAWVNGKAWGRWRGNKADLLRSLKGYVDAAEERPEAYPDFLPLIAAAMDDRVSAWHDGDDKRSLHEFMGLTWEQYQYWVTEPAAFLASGTQVLPLTYLTAAMPPKPEGDPQNPSQPPQPTVDEVLDAKLAAASAEARTLATRRRISAAVAGEILSGFGAIPELRPLLEPMVRRQAGAQAERLVAGTRDAVANVLLDALVEGWSVDVTADYLGAVLKEQAKWRAVMLARTDLIALSNGAAQDAVLVLGSDGPQFKTWVSAGDERVRETHVDANRQTVGTGEPFNVGGAMLQYPGDPLGPDSEVIQCRCVSVFSDTATPVLRHSFEGGNLMSDQLAVAASGDLDALLAAFNPTLHPHEPAGSSKGGQWAPKDMPATVVDSEESPEQLDGLEDGDTFTYNRKQFVFAGEASGYEGQLDSNGFPAVLIRNVRTGEELVVSAGLRPDDPFLKPVTARQAEAHLRGLSKGQLAVLDDAEERALTNYVGVSYKDINGSLRHGRQPGALTSSRITEITEAIDKLPPTTVPIRAYRGLNSWKVAFPGASSPEDAVGKVFTDKGFASTSLDENVAFHSTGGAGKNAAVVRIVVPAGTKGAWIPGLYTDPTKKGEGVKHVLARQEGEFLLQRGSRFKIVKAGRDRYGKTVFDVEVVP